VDGAKPQTLRELMEIEIVNQEEHDEAPSRVFEAAGGYSPTMGILGAVLGLIQVMGHLNEPDKLGGGIAVAFVATVYGVGFANLIYLPFATKLKLRARRTAKRRELMMEGVLAIQDGLNPRLTDPPAARPRRRAA
jgi:chemotaxis protein MotA